MPRTLRNPDYNTILEDIHEVIDNIVQTHNIKYTYIEKYSP